MNEIANSASKRLPTQAAEGLPRRRWTVTEIEKMLEAGIIQEDERFELIGGEVVPMSPKGIRHEVIKKALQKFWFRSLPDDVDLITETTLSVSEDEFVEPDFLFWPIGVALKDVTLESALLIVEVADTSLRYDLGRKAAHYARLGLRELWVIHANTLSSTICRNPGAAGFAYRREMGPNDRLEPMLMPHLAVRLADLSLS
ncbi:MAG: Uma2 family endonuclease [Hyphomicrobiaceae bacterium]